MNILIIEDEELAVKRLKGLLKEVDPTARVVADTDSIETSVEWLQNNTAPDLILMDIELSDGQSFEIFDLVDVKSTVIFTTSYDEYAIKAFKVNSADYLLKPIEKEDLQAALKKYDNLKEHYRSKNIMVDLLVKELQQKMQPKEYRKRFLVKQGIKLLSVNTSDIAYFYTDGRLNFFKTKDNRKFIVDYTLEELEDMLEPGSYFRINRSFYISVESVAKIDDYFGQRLMLGLQPVIDKEILVSRERVTEFKKWMGK
ncbi:LytR/AlgR family response regulator transcription factor [Terrimonas alba]|uniref:LytR/AlgR family response regulator transcription factor n=1 Tax=Terrimonas alba TaxID=3349636 RepID=UPI0035F45F42